MKQLMKKPFGTYFVERLRKVQISEKIDDDGDVNPFYQPKCMSVLETKWIPTLPIWTSLMRGDPRRHQEYQKTYVMKKDERTNGAVESWHNILKSIDHNHEKQLRPDVFLYKHYPLLLGRQIRFIEVLSLNKRKTVQVLYYCLI